MPPLIATGEASAKSTANWILPWFGRIANALPRGTKLWKGFSILAVSWKPCWLAWELNGGTKREDVTAITKTGVFKWCLG
eukprot:1738234-Amphidinium_carterae.1